jgi:hypothetical protein
MIATRKIVLAVCLLLASAASPSFAYVTNGRWVGNSATMRLSGVSFPSASQALNAVVAAKEQWDLNPSNFRFSLVFNDMSVAKGNGQSEIWIATGMTKPAATYPVYDSVTGNLIEADILFDVTKCWAFNPTSYTNLEGYGTTCRLMEASAIHELGHALGLAHESDEYNVMGNAWTHVHLNLSTVAPYVGEDASDGAVGLYGLSPTAGEDVSVSHWKYDAVATGTSQYSNHRRVQLYDMSGNELAWTTLDANSPRYDVRAGQRIQVEFTYENNGATTQSPQVDLVLSDNNWITAFDTWLATYNPTLGRNDVYTRTYTVTLPAGLTTGQKYIGVVVDPQNTIAEVDETNNATWIPVNVR